MFRTHRLGVPALAATTLALAVPTAASAAHGDDPTTLGRSDLRDVPTRVAHKLQRVERALDRAEGYVDDGDDAKAATAFRSTKRNLASALKAVDRRVGEDESGPAAAYAFTIVSDDVVLATIDDLDGTTGDVVTSIDEALNSAVDRRNELVASIAALSDASDYGDVVDQIVEDAADESADIDETLADDELTAEATSALGTAKTNVEAAGTAAEALAGTIDASNDDVADDSNDADADCPQGDHRGARGGDQTDDDTAATTAPAGRFRT